MERNLIKDGFVWGFLLWLIGFILGILFFMFLPKSMIGWAIMPIGIALSILVLLKLVKNGPLSYFLKIAIIWTAMAIIFDYLFLVQLFKPADGYYKLDVYIYYLSTFLLPLIAGWYRNKPSYVDVP